MSQPTALPVLSSLADFLSHEYDFVVIGGGTAGLAVAARLIENENVHVGVLEAGAANIGDPTIMMPALYPKLIGDPKYDWVHKSVPQQAAGGQAFDQPRGKGLGGSSAINFQMYVRGHARDYDDWEKLGNKGWGFKDMLPYFKKHEHFDDPSTYKNAPNIPLETKYGGDFHGQDGPIHTSFSTWRVPIEREFLAASAVLGDKMSSPINAWSGDNLGMYHTMSTIDRSGGDLDGTRSYAVTGYLLPNANRPNLHVLTEALVSKLVVNDQGVVSGVEFLHGEESHIVRVKKEVILCAGVFKSPQILELSGIGKPSVLTAAGIKPLVTNTQIGEHFHDHPASGIGFELAEGVRSLDSLQDPATLQGALAEYFTTKGGPLGCAGTAMGFASYADLASPAEIAAIQKSIMSTEYTGHDEATKRLIAESIADPGYGSIQLVLLSAALNGNEFAHQLKLFQAPPGMEGKQGVFLCICLPRSMSVGSVHITTSDPRDDPAIDPAYLSHPADVEVLTKGYELIMKIAKTSPLKEKLKRVYFPEEELDITDKVRMDAHLRSAIATQYHPLGTVRMGPEGIGAVDSRLQVYGTQGLRVIDASVIPLHVSGNIQSSVYAIAEKGADMIKEDWNL